MNANAVSRAPALLMFLGFVGVAVAAAPRQVASVEGMTEYVLDNGLRVLLVPDPTRPMLTVNLTLFVGSRHEGYGEAGMAHLLEHMLFKGTAAFPNPDQALIARGAKNNGSTWYDRTNYFETLPASDENLDFCIALEADRLVNCPIKASELASEMSVVRNEFEMGENDPQGILMQRVLSAAYEWHNYGKETIGNRSDIERVPADSLRRFYRKYYQPDNAMLIVAGRFDPATALASVQKHFGPIPRPQRILEQTYTEEPAQDGERIVTLRRVGEVGTVAMAFHVPAGSHEEFPAVLALQEILTSAPEGALYKALVETRKAASVGGFAPGLHDPGFLYLQADVRADQSRDQVRQLTLEALDRVVQAGVTEEQVQRVKTRFVAERRRALDDTSRLAVELSEWAAQGDWRLFFLARDRMEKLTASAVNAVARKYLRGSNRTVGIYAPTKEADRTPVPARPDVQSLVQDYKGRAAIEPGEQLDPDPAKLEARIQRQQWPNGIKVALLPKKTRQEAVTLRLTLRYGDEQTLRGRTAAADLLPSLITRGTRQLSRQALNDTLEKLEASLDASGSTGQIAFTLKAPRKNLPAALDLLRQVVREPALADAEFDLLQREMLADLEQQRTEPSYLARVALERKLNPYPKEDVRYTPTVDEEIERLRALKADDVRRLYSEFVGAQAGELVIVGQFEPGPTVAALQSMLANWKPAHPYARIAYKAIDVPASTDPIRTPDKANATYAAGFTVPMLDTDPDYPAVVLATEVLGGSPAARLWMRIREKEGLSYGVRARWSASPLDPVGQLRLSAIFGPANLAKVQRGMKEEIERLVKDGVESEELSRERESMLRQRAIDRTGDSTLVSLLSTQLYAGRTMSREADLDERLRTLTPAQVSAAAAKYLRVDRLVIIAAGDFPEQAR